MTRYSVWTRPYETWEGHLEPLGETDWRAVAEGLGFAALFALCVSEDKHVE